MNQAQLELKPKKERALKNRHPWVFSGAVAKVRGNPRPGDVLEIVSAEKEVLGYAHATKGKTIVARVFHFGEAPGPFDDAYWLAKFAAAVELRRTLYLPNGQTNGFRLIYSEADGLPGLICDTFDDVAVVQAKGEGIRALLPLLASFLKTHVKHIYVQDENDSDEKSGQWLLGQKPSVEFSENGLKIVANVVTGQKTGYFFDQRENRALVKRYAKGKRVLDVFCFSGGFTLNALSGGASEVLSVDSSKLALELTQKNVAANGFDPSKHSVAESDAFTFLRGLAPNAFDVIVLDPPAFAKSPSAIDRAARGYKDLLMHGLKKVTPGGLVFFFSCSQHISRDLFRKITFAAAVDARRNVKIIHDLGQAPCHPIDVCHPEGEYLKGLALYVTS
jgi:23S rRNA (cytosine1962-C5)-methyltransferase